MVMPEPERRVASTHTYPPSCSPARVGVRVLIRVAEKEATVCKANCPCRPRSVGAVRRRRAALSSGWGEAVVPGSPLRRYGDF